jgi:integrase
VAGDPPSRPGRARSLVVAFPVRRRSRRHGQRAPEVRAIVVVVNREHRARCRRAVQIERMRARIAVDDPRLLRVPEVRYRKADRNPVDAVEPPKVDRTEMRALDPVGISRLLEVANGTELAAPIAVAVGTGLRRGELLGLRWNDVDLEKGRLAVRRSVETVDGVRRTKPPKTTRSARTVAIPAFVVDVLRQARADQLSHRILLGLGREDDGWVFTRDDASPWEPGAFSLHFARLVKRQRLPHVRFHDLRHSYGTLALAAGVDLKTVSAAMGHSTIAMTGNTYLHAVASLERDSASRIDALLGDVVGAAMSGERISSVPQRCQTKRPPRGKPRHDGLFHLAPTGVEPVSPP